MKNAQGPHFQIVAHTVETEACAKFRFKGFEVSMSTIVPFWSDIAVIVLDPRGCEVWNGQTVEDAITWILKETA